MPKFLCLFLKRFFTAVLIFFFFDDAAAQKSVVVSGFIEDAASSERLIGASIIDDSTRNGTVTNSYGFFSFSTTAGLKNLTFSYIGYSAQTFSFDLKSDTAVTIKLSAGAFLKEVEVNAKKQDRIENAVQMSRVTVPIEQIKRMPMLLGESDVLKSLQLLPGVKAGTEGTSGIYVRGGSPDQNLILLDGVPIYNAAHIGGLFSVFNTDAIRNVTLTKGGFPARFGGRLSSVLEIDTKEGNKQAWHGDGAIGLLTSKILVEGPLIRDKLSMMVSARRTYFDVLLPFVFNSETTNQFGTSKNEQELNFYDLNLKLNYTFNEKNNLYFSVYNGHDIFKSTDIYTNGRQSSSYTNGFEYGNTLASLRWNNVVSNKLFVNTTLYYTGYGYTFIDQSIIKNSINPNTKTGILFESNVKDICLKTDFDYAISSNNRLRFGASFINHKFLPSNTSISNYDPQNGQRDTTYGGGVYKGNEFAMYAEEEFNLGKLSANIGVHAAAFAIRDQNFNSIQPRIGVSYPIKNWLTLKASYARMTQFVHLLTNDALGLPTDSWVPAVQGVGPEQSQQSAFGIAKNIGSQWELSVEGYYKTMDNLIAYQEGSGFLTQEQQWERKVTQGKGNAYGVEFFLQKKEGRTTGWIGYTLAWNNRQFDAINNGNPFPYKFDRRHEISVVLSRILKEHGNKKIIFTANWTFATGNAITVPIQLYVTAVPIDFYYVLNHQLLYDARNSYRTINTHRLDIGFEFLKKHKNWERKWSMGLYNAYNHANPFYYYVYNPSAIDATVYQSNLLPLLPFFSYGFKF